MVPITKSGNAFQVGLSFSWNCLPKRNPLFQSTFSVTSLEANLAISMLNSGQNSSIQNFITEGIFYALWRAPNFHGKSLAYI